MAYRKWILAALFGAVGCAGHDPRSVSDPDPADKIPAIKQATRENDKRAIPQLISDLDSDDPAVRFYAIDALHMLTGQTFNYRYYDEDEQRKPAVQKWKEWLANGRQKSVGSR